MMLQKIETVRRLTLADYSFIQNMQTNIQDDYILHVFPELVQSQTDKVFGLFVNDQLVTIAGYSLFPGGHAMLGRLRSDIRYRTSGYATKLLYSIIDHLHGLTGISWIGANTNTHNKAARKVLDKLEMKQIMPLYSYPVKQGITVTGVDGPVWKKITDTNQKRLLLEKIYLKKKELVYPFECYYPFPYSADLVTDQELHQSSCYLNPANDRFMLIKHDHKKEHFAQVKYFWDDHFAQAGFWNTVNHHINKDPLQSRPWLDFTERGVASIPQLEDFDIADGWVLYGKSL